MLIVAIVGCIVSALAVVVSAVAISYTRSDRHSKKLTDTIVGKITEFLHPFDQRVLVIEQRMGPDARERDRLLYKGMIAETIHPLEQVVSSMDVKMAGMDAKVSTLWDQLPLVMAKILHQPDPARHHVDQLLEAFMNGSMTAEERIELRKHLVTIRDWEPGTESPFPIHPGEQTAAAILLLTMDDPPPMARKR